jgi:hypothetical protein
MDPLQSSPQPDQGLAQLPGSRFNTKLMLIIGFGVFMLFVIVVTLLFGGGKNSGKTGANLPTGTVYVTTADSNTAISLTWLGDPSKVKTVDVANDVGTLDQTVPAGPYTVTATLGQFSSQQVITVTAGRTTSVSLKPSVLGAVEPVTDRQIAGVLATASQLMYIDTSNGNLYQVDSSGQEHIIDSGHGLTQVQWAYADYGVAMSVTKQLYLIRGTNVALLPLPFSGIATTTYGLAPNQDLYISNGKTIYVSTGGGAFKALYTSAGQVSIMAAGNDAVAATETGASGAKDQDSGNILTVTPSGVVSKRDGGAYGAAWSASGQYLGITSDEETIITDPSLKQITSFPVGNVTAPAWLGDTTLFYGVTSNLWQYNIVSGKATLLSTVHSGDYVSGISPSLSGDYVYLVMQNNGSASSNDPFYLDRVGLQGQQASNTAVALSGLLPSPVGSCTAGYINFEQTTVEIRGQGSNCTAAAQQLLDPFVSITGTLKYQYSAN